VSFYRRALVLQLSLRMALKRGIEAAVGVVVEELKNQNAASVAALLLTTDVVVTEKPNTHPTKRD